MLKSFLETPTLLKDFEEEYVNLYERVAFNWCCDQGDWDKTKLSKTPPIPLESFLKEGYLYWLLQERKS